MAIHSSMAFVFGEDQLGYPMIKELPKNLLKIKKSIELQ